MTWHLRVLSLAVDSGGAYLCMTDMTTFAVLASSPVVGSSKNKIGGDFMSSMPMLTRLRSPPDTPRINSLPTYKGFHILF